MNTTQDSWSGPLSPESVSWHWWLAVPWSLTHDRYTG